MNRTEPVHQQWRRRGRIYLSNNQMNGAQAANVGGGGGGGGGGGTGLLDSVLRGGGGAVDDVACDGST